MTVVQKSQVTAFNSEQTSYPSGRRLKLQTKEQSLPRSLKKWAKTNAKMGSNLAVGRSVQGILADRVKPSPQPKVTPTRPQIISLRKSAAVSKVSRRKSWDILPPSLQQWAVDKGIVKSQENIKDPLKVRPQFSAVEKRRTVFEALQRGEWCWARDIDWFPPKLRQWLKHCRVRLVRDMGGFVKGTPVNGYVTEDGTVFYVAEDGLTFYVQES